MGIPASTTEKLLQIGFLVTVEVFFYCIVEDGSHQPCMDGDCPLNRSRIAAELKLQFRLILKLFFIRFIHFYFMCECFARMYIRAPCAYLVPVEVRWGIGPLKLEFYGRLWATVGVLGMESMSSAGATQALNCEPSLHPQFSFMFINSHGNSHLGLVAPRLITQL